MQQWIQACLHPAVVYGKGVSAEKSAALILESYVEKKFCATLDFTKCFDCLRVPSTTAMLRQQGFHEGLASLCEMLWTDHSRWCSFDNFTSSTPLKPQGMGIPQGDPLGPLITACWRCCCARLQLAALFGMLRRVGGAASPKTSSSCEFYDRWAYFRVLMLVAS
eukprot:Skav204131  [mRNA]  locus=scaffold2473:265468:265959:- [translate_table: standard]